MKILVHEFETITFSHVPRAQNHYVDTIANNILARHLSHVYHRR
ncbi:reverse transcriptase-like protein [Actinobacillus pleuropneumoniae]